MAAQPFGVSDSPPRFLSSANFLRVHFVPASRSLMKMLTYVGHQRDDTKLSGAVDTPEG